MRLLKTFATWTLQLLLGGLLLMIGIGKFSSASWVRRFDHWGYPDGFVLVVGALEVLLALCLFMPRLTSYAAALLMVVMIGAALTHLAHGETRQLTSPVAFFVLLGVLAWLRKGSAVPVGRAAAPRRQESVV